MNHVKREVKTIRLLLLLVSVILIGCGGSEPSISIAEKPPSDDTVARSSDTTNPAANAVVAKLEKSGSIVFASHDGQSTGSEGALTLTLLPGGIAKVDYNPGEGEPTSGSYTMEDSGLLKLDFGADDPWLPMQITSQDGTLLVNAPDKEEIIRTAFEAGIRRDEITEEDIKMAFQAWPLRELITAD